MVKLVKSKCLLIHVFFYNQSVIHNVYSVWDIFLSFSNDQNFVKKTSCFDVYNAIFDRVRSMSIFDLFYDQSGKDEKKD